MRQSMKEATKNGTWLEQLKALARLLAEEIDGCEDCKALSQLAKQYRDTIREIENIEGMKNDGDEIGEVLAQRQADGKSRAVRKGRAGLQKLGRDGCDPAAARRGNTS